MEPILRWLHVGGRGYEHGCIKDIQPETDLERLANKISSGAFAHDLICLCTKTADLRAQAEKLSLYSDWAALIVSGKDTKVTGLIHSADKYRNTSK